MIDAKSLRIGNWIKRNSSGNYQQVKEVLTTCVFLQNEPPLNINKHMTIPVKNISPIPLDPDILEKAGFVKYDDSDNDYTVYGNSHDDSDFFLQLDWRRKTDGYTPLIKCGEYEIIGVNIKYVHQLQNLFYSLTGKELEINF